MEISEVITSVYNGDYDLDLQSLSNAIRSRKDFIRNREASEKLLDIKVGDTVMFTDISPKYLKGIKATVVSLNGKKDQYIKVDIGQDQIFARRYRGSKGVGVPITCVEKVAE